MKNFVLALLVSSLFVSGVAVAQQSGKKEEGPPMKGMMEDMMKSGKDGGHMEGMMRMMKMMDQCSAMMDSSEANAGKTEQGQQK
jgi:hypothetical protein